MHPDIINKFRLTKSEFMYRNTFVNATRVYQFPEPVNGRQVLISESDGNGDPTPGEYRILIMWHPEEFPRTTSTVTVTEEFLLDVEQVILDRLITSNSAVPIVRN